MCWKLFKMLSISVLQSSRQSYQIIFKIYTYDTKTFLITVPKFNSYSVVRTFWNKNHFTWILWDWALEKLRKAILVTLSLSWGRLERAATSPDRPRPWWASPPRAAADRRRARRMHRRGPVRRRNHRPVYNVARPYQYPYPSESVRIFFEGSVSFYKGSVSL